MRFTCSKCGKALRVSEEMAGKRGKCPACGEVLLAPHRTSSPPQSVTVSRDSITSPTPAVAPAAPNIDKAMSHGTCRENAPITGKTSNPEQAREHLKQVYQDFAKPSGRITATFNGLLILIVIPGIIISVYHLDLNWILGVIGGIAVLAVMVYASDRVEAPHKRRAKERVSQLEKTFGLSHEESFDLLLPTRSGTEAGGKAEWKTFLTEVWGEGAARSIHKKAESDLAPSPSDEEKTQMIHVLFQDQAAVPLAHNEKVVLWDLSGLVYVTGSKLVLFGSPSSSKARGMMNTVAQGAVFLSGGFLAAHFARPLIEGVTKKEKTEALSGDQIDHVVVLRRVKRWFREAEETYHVFQQRAEGMIDVHCFACIETDEREEVVGLLRRVVPESKITMMEGR